jgi:hypothetical protein
MFIPNCEMSAPVNLFLDLTKLEGVIAKGIFSSLLQHLQPFGMTEDCLDERLVSVACDGAALMLGNHSGVKKLITEKCMFGCINHLTTALFKYCFIG